MLEAIEHLAADSDPMDLPNWQAEFDGNKDAFAEDFARLCVTFDALHESFWEPFMVAYAREYHRVFVA